LDSAICFGKQTAFWEGLKSHKKKNKL